MREGSVTPTGYQFMDKNVELREVKPHDFEQNVLGGEIKPHDVEIKIKFRDGTEKTTIAKWELIIDLYKYHGESAVQECYELAVS